MDTIMDNTPEAEDSQDEVLFNTTAPVHKTRSGGFLPIDTNTFDRYFISVVVLVAFHLLWMRFIEEFIPLFVATIISIILGFFIVRWG